jgi:rhamnulokinase
LCQATADACGLPVIAGPAEATAVGNLLVQARAADELGDDLKSLRACVRRSAVLVEYEPGATEPWDRAHASLE